MTDKKRYSKPKLVRLERAPNAGASTADKPPKPVPYSAAGLRKRVVPKYVPKAYVVFGAWVMEIEDGTPLPKQTCFGCGQRMMRCPHCGKGHPVYQAGDPGYPATREEPGQEPTPPGIYCDECDEPYSVYDPDTALPEQGARFLPPHMPDPTEVTYPCVVIDFESFGEVQPLFRWHFDINPIVDDTTQSSLNAYGYKGLIELLCREFGLNPSEGQGVGGVPAEELETAKCSVEDYDGELYDDIAFDYTRFTKIAVDKEGAITDEQKMIAIDSTLDCESKHFCQRFDFWIGKREDAAGAAKDMLHQAFDWCVENGIVLDPSCYKSPWDDTDYEKDGWHPENHVFFKSITANTRSFK